MFFRDIPEVIVASNIPNFTSAYDKGYPKVIPELKYFIKIEEQDIAGYTSYVDMGNFYFVGNTYIQPKNRGKGHYKTLLSERNKLLTDKPKITLVNPIQGTDISILEKQVSRGGGQRINSYSQVQEIMSKEVYNCMSVLPMYIYR